jgi:hypothetical protein
MSSPNFRSILDAAFDRYAKQTGIDIKEYAATTGNKFWSCTSPEAVLELLQEREMAFKNYRDENRGLINCLRPVIQVLNVFSGVLGEVAGLVRLGGSVYYLI